MGPSSEPAFACPRRRFNLLSEPRMARLHLVDGTFELFRAHFAPIPYKPKKATLGIVRSMKALARDKVEAPTHVAIAFDNPIRSFRNDLYADYKSDEGVLPELREQFDEAEEAVKKLGMVVWSMREWETDDALATACVKYARRLRSDPHSVAGQRLRADAFVAITVVQVDRVRKKFIDEKSLRALRGFGPESIADWLALVGDSADGFPGRHGVWRQERGRAAREVRPRRGHSGRLQEVAQGSATSREARDRARGQPRECCTLQTSRDARHGRPARRVDRRSPLGQVVSKLTIGHRRGYF